MGTVYQNLLSVAVKHSFYQSGIARDITVTPVAETNALMRNNKLLFRLNDTGFQVLYRTQETGTDPFIDFANIDLRFTLSLKSVTEFTNITNLADGVQAFKPGNLVYFTNANPALEELDYSIIDALRPAVFAYTFPQLGGALYTGSIVITNEAGTNVTPSGPGTAPSTNIPPDSNDAYTYLVDLRSLPPGLYTFTTTVNAVVVARRIYIDTVLNSAGIFGIVKLSVANPVDMEGTTYNASFVRRNSKWRYVLVPKLSKADVGDLLLLQDPDAVNPAPYEPTYAFTAGTNVIVNGITSAVFESDETIPFYETTLRKLNVKAGSVVLMDSAPNPARLVISADPVDFDTTLIYVIV